MTVFISIPLQHNLST